MRIAVTGSSGHLGEAVMRTLADKQREAVGIDLIPGAFTTMVGSVSDRGFVADALSECDAVIHAATLHKPHVATHSSQGFVDTNILGTLNVLEEAVAQGNKPVVYTSTTSTFGRALTPEPDQPAAWITEEVRPVPKNIYGVTKAAAENLCELFHYRCGLPCLVLKTSRFFPEEDDDAARRKGFADLNLKVNELLYRRLDIEDAANAHLLAIDRAESIGFGRYILSATTPIRKDDLALSRTNLAQVISGYIKFNDVYEMRGWRMIDGIDRVYVNAQARRDLGWEPLYTFEYAIERLRGNEPPFSDLTRIVGSKGYHPGQAFDDGPYPVG